MFNFNFYKNRLIEYGIPKLLILHSFYYSNHLADSVVLHTRIKCLTYVFVILICCMKRIIIEIT